MPAPAAHHEIFRRFVPWSGCVAEGFVADFLGVRTRRCFYERNEFMAALYEESAGSGARATTAIPALNEEYFEWVALLEAIDKARGQFTMMELGAGYGRWLVRGAVAARSYGLPCRLVGVEAEPTHFRWMQQHLLDNGVPSEEVTLVEAAVSSDEGEAWFLLGNPYAEYGQQLVASGDDTSHKAEGMRLEQVKTVSLTSLLTAFDHVDLIDMDVQGAELDVLMPAQGLLDEKVRRVHIATHTHDNRQLEAGLRRLFGGLGWDCLYHYPCGGTYETRWGLVTFIDGVQDWQNPKLT